MNKTLLLIKPNAVRKNKIGAVLAALEEKGIIIRNMKMLTFTHDCAEEFYVIHRGKPFFENLISFMTSGPIVAAVLEHENCVEYVRRVIGNTDPIKAADGTIRQLYGDSLTENAVHASDSDENAERETAIVFGERFNTRILL